MNVSFPEATAAAVVCGAVWLISDDWLAGASVLVLLIGLKLVGTSDRLFVLPAAFAFHWSQTTIGLLYKGFLGRDVIAITESDYRPMVLIGLGCCLMIALGIRLGLVLIKAPDPDEERPGVAFPLGLLVVLYVLSVIFEGTLETVAPEYPSLRQIIVTMDLARLGVLFLIFRRVLHPAPRWGLFGFVVALEIVLGLTGFFAGFREPVVLAAIAMLEIFDRRNPHHWTALAVAAVMAVGLGLLWMGIRVDFRRDYIDVDAFQTSRSMRFDRITGLTSGFLKSDATTVWEAADKLVDRMWTIYYPALALRRVPETVGHTDGAILRAAIVHILTPRVFFPDKPDLPSDSEEVRRYAGVMVAGREQNTSIAFGYAAEGYIDFGLPLMFAPVFVFGLILGFSYALYRRLIWHRELFVSFATVSYWLSLYLFERSWANLLGVWLGFMVYLGLPILLLDRFLLVRFVKRPRHRMAQTGPEPQVT